MRVAGAAATHEDMTVVLAMSLMLLHGAASWPWSDSVSVDDLQRIIVEQRAVHAEQISTLSTSVMQLQAAQLPRVASAHTQRALSESGAAATLRLSPGGSSTPVSFNALSNGSLSVELDGEAKVTVTGQGHLGLSTMVPMEMLHVSDGKLRIDDGNNWVRIGDFSSSTAGIEMADNNNKPVYLLGCARAPTPPLCSCRGLAHASRSQARLCGGIGREWQGVRTFASASRRQPTTSLWCGAMATSVSGP